MQGNLLLGIRLLAGLAPAFFLSACAALVPPDALSVLREAAFCPGGKDRQVVLLTDQASLEAYWRFSSDRLPTGAPPKLDFSRQAALFLADAERPSAGYGLRLGKPEPSVADGRATLHIETSVPAGLTAQVITRPCLLLALPLGAYRRIEVIDQDGQLWGTARLPSAAPAAQPWRDDGG